MRTRTWLIALITVSFVARVYGGLYVYDRSRRIAAQGSCGLPSTQSNRLRLNLWSQFEESSPTGVRVRIKQNIGRYSIIRLTSDSPCLEVGGTVE